MATVTKPKKPARKVATKRSTRSVRAAVLDYGITPRALPAKVARAGDAKAKAGDFGKGADWAAIEAAYEARNL